MEKAELLRLARVGAEARLNELRTEEAAILKAFPDLRGRRTQLKSNGIEAAPARQHRRKMSAAARKAVSERMKKYWAGRRKKSQ